MTIDRRGVLGLLGLGATGACATVGEAVPSDAVFARGRVYCGSEHRDADAGNGRSDTGRS